ncbi:xanthine dehydrogenase [Thioclava sp. SK-1]|uniref:aldehyde oxidoreductase molybdenum-binding subunit PaoC n=1 Tax=Thioclava sp. SK-1 TaxID=1889770 RepID=UPI0008263DD3|nr:aldehyde oxidoreductase molybdenum-binding subunit PaoC [Thioclava sp. SK-1]OCX61176.1 xanthine dehydrogenase [Thioclava sp. SK-1]
MKFTSPATETIFDTSTVVGKATHRVDGPLKVSGRAPYAYERHDVIDGQLVAYPLGATIAKGRILSIDTQHAKAAPGVHTIITTLEYDELPKDERNVASLFGGDKVVHYHQAIAAVVADSFEQARAAANLITVKYDIEQDLDFDLERQWQQRGTVEPVSATGDFAQAFQSAAKTLDREYRTPGHSHAMMEPHSTLAHWDGDALTIWTSNQMIAWNREALAVTLGLEEDNIRVDSPYIGGGFGSKLFLRSDAVLAALASKASGRPVKLALPRPFVMNNTTHRGETIQRIRIGTDAQGHITAIAHTAMSPTQPGGQGEQATDQTRQFYAGANRLIEHHPVEMFLPESNAMRAPGEASGLMALEIAMDEMAEVLDMDPVAFRALNDTQVDPENPKRTFSDRNFTRCLSEGARAFGWHDRPQTPASRRDGNWLIGMGMAGAYRGSPVLTSGARVRLQANGTVIVETDMTDIGTGSYTIIAQTAAEVMGLPVSAIDVRLGDSNFPRSAGSGGQFGAPSSTAGVYAACVKLREMIAQKLQMPEAELSFSDGAVHSAGEPQLIGTFATDAELVAEDKIEFGKFRSDDHIVSTFGAHFVELRVHALTGEIRLNRMLAVCDSGRILNPITARSQVIGGMVMGVGAAMMEEMAVDRTQGFFANHDLAGYEVPVHMDIPSQEVIFLDTLDPVATPMKAKGIGELGLCGVAAAVANAAYNATGVRLRDYPVTLEKLFPGLPKV